jgi:hypothetical protein
LGQADRGAERALEKKGLAIRLLGAARGAHAHQILA